MTDHVPTSEGLGDEHRYAGTIEAPKGSWYVRCGCGWSMRSLSSHQQANSEYDRHEAGLEWWEPSP